MEDHANIFARNNTGVGYLLNGETNLALAYFRAAFEEAKTRCQLEEALNAPDESSGSHNDEMSSSSQDLGWPLPVRDHFMECLRLATSSDARCHGFLLLGTTAGDFVPGGSKQDSTSTTRTTTTSLPRCSSNMTLATAFIVFNLGLVYNILGRQSSNVRQLMKSRALIDSCRRLLLTRCNSIPMTETLLPTENPEVDLLWVMMLTKLAETNYLLSEAEQAETRIAQIHEFFKMIRMNPDYTKDSEVNQLLEAIHQRIPGSTNKTNQSVSPSAPAA